MVYVFFETGVGSKTKLLQKETNPYE